MILLTDAPLPLLNVVAGIVYALAMPFVALTTAYADARVREELEPAAPRRSPRKCSQARFYVPRIVSPSAKPTIVHIAQYGIA